MRQTYIVPSSHWDFKFSTTSQQNFPVDLFKKAMSQLGLKPDGKPSRNSEISNKNCPPTTWDVWNPINNGKTTYQLVQDFSHQQYGRTWILPIRPFYLRNVSGRPSDDPTPSTGLCGEWSVSFLWEWVSQECFNSSAWCTFICFFVRARSMHLILGDKIERVYEDDVFLMHVSIL